MKNRRILSLAALFAVALVVVLPAQAETKNTRARSKQVDKLVNKLLAEQKLEAHKPISDEQFVRRIYLAAIGRIPSGSEAAEFLASKDKNKREKLIDELLESEGYVSHFYNYWADILRLNTRLGRSGNANEYAYKHWVKESLRSNKPYNQFVREMVSATGETWENGAAGYYHRDRGMPLDNMANTVRIFLGTRLECAQCHDHPFDKWSQKDFFKMASFTYGVRAGYNRNSQSEVRREMQNERRKKIMEISQRISGIKGFYPTRREADIDRMYEKDDRRSVYRRKGIATAEEYKAINKKVLAATAKYDRDNRITSQILSDIYNPIRYSSLTANDRNSKLPHDYQYDDAKPNDEIAPEPMFDSKFNADGLDESYLDTYADWMTSTDNPRFAQVVANRLWKKAFGVGLIEPVDQITDYTKPYNPELMAYLEKSMKELNFDMKSFLAMLYKTEAWQRSAHAEEIPIGKPYYFQGPALKRMTAEQIWDSLSILTIDDPDHFQPNLGRELRTIDGERKIYEELSKHTPEQFKTILKELTAQARAGYAKQEKLREKYNKARAEEDQQLIRELGREIRDVQRELRSNIAKVAYNNVGRSGGRSMEMMMAGAGMTGSGERYVRTSLPRVETKKMPEGLSASQRKNWVRQQKSMASSWSHAAAGMARASELPTPAPRGHFLREFGQSDRELIENANDGASVPQALSLMNGDMAYKLMHPYSVLGRSLDKCDSPEEEIRTIYQLMLTRQPTKAETERLLKVYETEGKNARRSVIWAMLNTQQFIFSI